MDLVRRARVVGLADLCRVDYLDHFGKSVRCSNLETISSRVDVSWTVGALS